MIIELTDEEFSIAENLAKVVDSNKYKNVQFYRPDILESRIMGFAGELAAAKYFNCFQEKVDQFKKSIVTPKWDDGVDIVISDRINLDIKTTKTLFLYAHEKNVVWSKCHCYVLVEYISKNSYDLCGWITKHRFLIDCDKKYNPDKKEYSYSLHKDKLNQMDKIKKFIS